MILTVIKDIARPHVIDIIMLLKRGRGMSVNEIAAAMRMSYMGIKQHCIYLEKKGYLSTWRRPKSTGGRPEKMYRLTKKLEVLFPTSVGEAVGEMLTIASQTLGDDSVGPLLRGFFQKREARFQAMLKGRTLLERAQSLTKLLVAEGCISMCEFDPHEGLRIIEYHSTLDALMAGFPDARLLEQEMLARLLKCSVERMEVTADEVTRIEFRLKNQPEA